MSGPVVFESNATEAKRLRKRADDIEWARRDYATADRLRLEAARLEQKPLEPYIPF